MLTITFRGHGEGQGKVTLEHARVLLHDGLGTDAPVKPSIDAIVTVEAAPDAVETRTAHSSFTIVRAAPTLDIDGDGGVTYSDLRAFIFAISSGDSRHDFDQDGSVGLSDFSMLFRAIESH